MVTPTCYPGESRRYSSRTCSPYSTAGYADLRRHPPLANDTRTSSSAAATATTATMAEREPEPDTSQPRKRIAVACGRCRKRKIRCSGDPGNGLQCFNCKNAGIESCLFLRVQSTETPFKPEGAEFPYSLDASRTYHARSSATLGSLPTTTVVPYGHEVSPPSMTPEEAYRHQPSGYTYSAKPYYSPVPSWVGYPADPAPMEYNGMAYQPYSYVSGPETAPVAPYRMSPGGKMEPEPAYPYASTATLVHRPAEPQGYPVSHVAASLQSRDRVAPTPVSRAYRHGSISHSPSPGLKSASPGSTSATTSAMSEAGYSNAYAGSPVTSMSAYHAPPSLPSMIRQESPYSCEPVSIFSRAERSLHTQGPGTESVYCYGSDSTDRRGSATASGTLPNGHAYTVPAHASSVQGHHIAPSSYLMTGGNGTAGTDTGVTGELPGGTADGGAAASTSGTSSTGAHRRSAASSLRAA